LTKNFGDEIMGWKEKLRERGIPEEDTSKAIREITKIIETEKRPPDLERIKEEHTAKRKNSSIVNLKEAEHGIEPAKTGRVEGVRPETLEAAPPEAVQRPPEVEPTGRVPEPGRPEHPERLPEGERSSPEERIQTEPSPRDRVGAGEGGVAPETERGTARVGEPAEEQPVREPVVEHKPTLKPEDFRITPQFEIAFKFRCPYWCP
jgi:hypothetical protein